MSEVKNIPEGWVETTLGEVVNTNLESIDNKYPYQEIYYLDTGSITEGKIEELQYFKLKDAPSRAKRIIKNCDIIYSTVRPNQKHYGYIVNPLKNLIVSTGFTVINSKEIDSSKFLYYWITQNTITTYLHQIAEQSASAYPSIKPSDIEKLKITLPKDVNEQKSIAAILTSFDDKIELLQAQNKTLEEMAQTIFTEWFGKYQIEDELPDGWSVGKLSEIANFLNGLALQKYPPIIGEDSLPVIKIREIKQGITSNTDRANTHLDEKYIIENGDVIFSWSGSLDVVIWQYGKGALNQHLFKVSSDIYPKWFFYHWLLFHLNEFKNIAATKATTMGHINRNHLDLAEIIIPDDETLNKLDSLFNPLLDKLETNNSQIQTLTKTRDTLLPRLMSGEMRVKM